MADRTRIADDPFVVVTEESDEANVQFSDLVRRSAAVATAAHPGTVTTARLHGFDLSDRPVLVGVSAAPHEMIPARSTVPLLQAHVGGTVVVVFEDADPHRPIILGVIREPARGNEAATAPRFAVHLDDERIELEAERQIVLRCGDASITLTRAGKVIVKGTYVLSRSSGYNKIKGAAVDIN